MLLILLPAGATACLRSEAVPALARIGVTSLALVRDERSTGVVVEGWAFDPIVSAEAVIAAVSEPSEQARALQPVMEMTLTQGDRR
jgi:hypothetical protein